MVCYFCFVKAYSSIVGGEELEIGNIHVEYVV